MVSNWQERKIFKETYLCALPDKLHSRDVHILMVKEITADRSSASDLNSAKGCKIKHEARFMLNTILGKPKSVAKI